MEMLEPTCQLQSLVTGSVDDEHAKANPIRAEFQTSQQTFDGLQLAEELQFLVGGAVRRDAQSEVYSGKTLICRRP
jgi:hypothetical protein